MRLAARLIVPIALVSTAAALSPTLGPEKSARPVGAPVYERALAVDFPTLGRVTVRPFAQRTTAQRQCGAVLTRRDRRSQRLTTLGIGESETESCGSLVAVGRIPAPPGRHRLLFLYRNYAQFAGAGEADAAIRPVVVTGSTDRRWRVDDDLSTRLNDGSVRTIADARRILRRASR